MSFAVPTYVKRGSAIAAVFLFWLVLFGTVKLKHHANYKNYAHCIRYNPQADNDSVEDIKKLSKTYNIPSEKVEAILLKSKEWRVRIKESLEIPLFGHGEIDLVALDLSARKMDFPSKREMEARMRLYKSITKIEPLEMKEPDMKTRFKRKAGDVSGGVKRVYFKLFNISFSRKPCK